MSTGSGASVDRQVVDLASLGVEGWGEARFGAALAPLYSADGDQCLDVAVGAPGAGQTGVVFLLHGSADGFKTVDAFRLFNAEEGDEFGASIATGVAVVWAGAPGRDVNGVVDAGAVAVFGRVPGDPSESTPVVSIPIETTQASPGVPGTPERGDRYGEVLTYYSQEYGNASMPCVLVGVPREDVGTAADAGIVGNMCWEGSRTVAGANLSQDGPGLASSVEAGDRFGAAVVVGAGVAAIGSPGEDLGRIRNAGTATLFIRALEGSGDFQIEPFRGMYGISQNSPRVPGQAETGDEFGAALAVASYCNVADRRGEDIAIGARGEDLGSVDNAGAVTLFDSGFLYEAVVRPQCGSIWLQQGGRAPGRARSGNLFGSDISYQGSPWVAGRTLLVTAPGQSSGAGVVDTVNLTPPLRPAEERSYVGGSSAGLGYGVLPTR